MKVFLGGTCNGSTWRDDLIGSLKMDYYNPVVTDWTPECMEEERRQREECDFCLYVITPKMTGVYSIAEVVEDSIKIPKKTLFSFNGWERNNKQFTAGQTKSLKQVGEMVVRNGGLWLSYPSGIIYFLNNREKENNNE